LTGDATTAEKSWVRVVELEKDTAPAAQAHFGLAALYRKEGKAAKAQQEMLEFQKLQRTIGPPRSEWLQRHPLFRQNMPELALASYGSNPHWSNLSACPPSQ